VSSPATLSRTVLAGFLIIAMAMAGCDRSGGYTPKYTYAQAVAKADSLIRDAAATLTPSPRLEVRYENSLPCSGSFDAADSPLVLVERQYWLRDLEPRNNPHVFEQMFQYWKQNGFTLARTLGPEDQYDQLRKAVATGPDDFNQSIVQAVGGEMSIRVQSPCVYDPDEAT